MKIYKEKSVGMSTNTKCFKHYRGKEYWCRVECDMCNLYLLTHYEKGELKEIIKQRLK